MSMCGLPPHRAWRRPRDMQNVVAQQPAIAHAVHCLPLNYQLELTLELLKQDAWPDFEISEPLPPNVVRFRLRSAATPRAPVCCWWTTSLC